MATGDRRMADADLTKLPRFSGAELMNLVTHCAQECEWQMSGEKSVGWMVDGWLWVMSRTHGEIFCHEGIQALGHIVERRKNDGYSYRQVGVRVGASVKLPWQQVPQAMHSLLEHGLDLDPVEWFREYEEIHPFRDGNGRTGNILFNVLNGTINHPTMPPNLWADERRY